MSYTRFKYTEDEREEQLQKYNVITETDNGRIIVNCNRLADLIKKEYDYSFITMRDSKDIYYFNGTLWQRKGETIIKYLTGLYLEDLSTEHRKNEVIGNIRDSTYESRDIFYEEWKLDFINFKNGEYYITNDIFEDTTFPGYHFLYYLPIDYNKDADCPIFKKFLSEIIYKEDIPVIQEFFGYCLYRKYHLAKILLLYGEGRNGKSTLLNVLTRFLGTKNVSAKELHALCSGKFETSSLFGKLANVASDISNVTIKESGILKNLTGGDLGTDAQFKFKDSFTFRNYAKLIFSANRIPQSKDGSYAYYSRWILINFPNTFEGKNKNPHLIDELTTKEELSGILNWAIQGLKRLLKNGEFSYTKSVEEVMDIYKSGGDFVYNYCREYLNEGIGSFILKDNLYQHYESWCKENKVSIVPKNMMITRLQKYLPKTESKKRGTKGNQKPVYLNISWKKSIN